MQVTEDSRQKQLKAFRKLPEEWRSAQLGTKDIQVLYKQITTVAINTVQLNIAKELDEDLKNLKEQVKNAQEVYTEGNKTNALKIKFLVDILRDRGEDVPDPEVFLKKAANGEIEEQS